MEKKERENQGFSKSKINFLAFLEYHDSEAKIKMHPFSIEYSFPIGEVFLKTLIEKIRGFGNFEIRKPTRN